MKTHFDIGTLEPPQVVLLWPVLRPMLEAGAEGMDADSVTEALRDVFGGRARIWVISDDSAILAAFLTAVILDKDGNDAVDVYGLGGRAMLKWGQALTERMVEYAQANGCKRVLFRGRKALQRAYHGIEIVGLEPDGTHIYERAVS